MWVTPLAANRSGNALSRTPQEIAVMPEEIIVRQHQRDRLAEADSYRLARPAPNASWLRFSELRQRIVGLFEVRQITRLDEEPEQLQ
jgi:hypothetical protein